MNDTIMEWDLKKGVKYDIELPEAFNNIDLEDDDISKFILFRTQEEDDDIIEWLIEDDYKVMTITKGGKIERKYKYNLKEDINAR